MRFAKLRWPRSLGVRLLSTYVAGILISMLLVLSVFAALLFGDSDMMLEDSIAAHAVLVGNSLQFDSAGRPVGLDNAKIPAWLYAGMGRETMFRVVDGAGRVVLPEAQEVRALVREGRSFEARRRSFVLHLDGVQMRAATEPVIHQGRTWYVQVAASQRLVDLMRRSVGVPMLGRGILGACLVSVLVFAVAMYFTLGRMLKPLREVSDSAARIAPRTLDARLDVKDLPSELLPLIDAFNRALGRLEKGYKAQQDFLAAAAHELKTPLALIRAQVELNGGSTDRTALIRDVDQMARHVNQLLHLAEASELQNYQIRSVDATTLVDEVGNYLSRLADKRGVHLEFRVGPDAFAWHADRGALFTLLKNLLENAIQHSPRHGVVRLDANVERVVVSDEGVGILPEHQALVFVRFWRGPGRRDEGAGLGLAICQEIATAHGWQLSVSSSSLGTEFAIVFGS